MAVALKRYVVEVKYNDRRAGPSMWDGRATGGTIRIAINRGLRQFFRDKPFRGRDPYRFLTVQARKVAWL